MGPYDHSASQGRGSPCPAAREAEIALPVRPGADGRLHPEQRKGIGKSADRSARSRTRCEALVGKPPAQPARQYAEAAAPAQGKPAHPGYQHPLVSAAHLVERSLSVPRALRLREPAPWSFGFSRSAVSSSRWPPACLSSPRATPPRAASTSGPVRPTETSPDLSPPGLTG